MTHRLDLPNNITHTHTQLTLKYIDGPVAFTRKTCGPLPHANLCLQCQESGGAFNIFLTPRPVYPMCGQASLTMYLVNPPPPKTRGLEDAQSIFLRAKRKGKQILCLGEGYRPDTLSLDGFVRYSVNPQRHTGGNTVDAQPCVHNPADRHSCTF